MSCFPAIKEYFAGIFPEVIWKITHFLYFIPGNWCFGTARKFLGHLFIFQKVFIEILFSGNKSIFCRNIFRSLPENNLFFRASFHFSHINFSLFRSFMFFLNKPGGLRPTITQDIYKNFPGSNATPLQELLGLWMHTQSVNPYIFVYRIFVCMYRVCLYIFIFIEFHQTLLKYLLCKSK